VSRRGLVYTDAEYAELVARMGRLQGAALDAVMPTLRTSAGPVPAVSPERTDDRPEAVLLGELQALAKRHGWHGYDTYHREDGVLCWLWRDTSVLVVQLLPARAQLTMACLDTLKQTGHVEVYSWRPIPQDRKAMHERLTRRTQKEPTHARTSPG
jgi:hypothetical protein